MTETYTVWYGGETRQDSYLCKQKIKQGTDERNMREGTWAYCTPVTLWIFSITPARQKRSRIFKGSDRAIEKYQRRKQRRHSRGPASVWLAAPQRECQPTPEAMQLQQDIQDLSTHFTVIIHEENWHSAAPDAHISPAYLQGSLELFFFFLPARNKASLCSAD